MNVFDYPIKNKQASSFQSRRALLGLMNKITAA